MLAALGDRLSLFKELATGGAATNGELAARTGLSERYLREWLNGMFAAGYLIHDPVQHSYALPAEHAPALATEPGPAFFGGVHQELLGAIQRYHQVATAFRDGGGVAAADLNPDVGRDQPVHRRLAPQHARPAMAAAGPSNHRQCSTRARGSPVIEQARKAAAAAG